MEPFRTLLVEDEPIIRYYVSGILEDSGRYTVVGTAGDAPEAIAAAAELEPDVVLMDVRLPRGDGAEATAAIRDARPETVVVAMSSLTSPTTIAGVLRAGAVGYLSKNARPEEILRALDAAMDGTFSFSPEVGAAVVGAMSATTPDRPAVPRTAPKLSPREHAALRLLVRGLSNAQIAERLGVSESAVKARVHRLMRRLDADTRTGVAVAAVRLGLVPEDDD